MQSIVDAAFLLYFASAIIYSIAVGARVVTEMKIDMPGDIMKFTQAICLLSLYGDTLMPFHASSQWMAVVKEYACAVLHFVVLLATYVVPGCERPEDEYKRASMAVGALAHYVSAFHLIYKGEGEAKESPSPRRRPPPRAA